MNEIIAQAVKALLFNRIRLAVADSYCSLRSAPESSWGIGPWPGRRSRDYHDDQAHQQRRGRLNAVCA